MKEQEVITIITKIFQDTFPELKGSDLDMEKPHEDFERWDSFTHMDLISKVEEAFEIVLEIDEVIALHTPNAFVHLVLSKKGS